MNKETGMSYLEQKVKGNVPMKRYLIFMHIIISIITSSFFPPTAGAANVSEPFYEIQAEFNTQEGAVDVNLNLNLPIHLLENGSLSFLFSSNAEVHSISGPHLNDYQIEEGGPEISLYHLDFDNPPGESVAIEMNYTLVIPNNHQVNRISANWIELNIDSFWHPVLTSLTRFHYRLTMDLVDSYQILSGDRVLTGAKNSSSQTIESIIPRIDVSFSASKKFYSKEGQYSKVYSTSESTDLDSLLLLSEKALVFLEEYIAREEDFTDKRLVVESPRKEVGYARENYIMLSQLDEMNAAQLSAFLTHEFSHYWFMNGNPQGPDNWLNESFAEYISMLYIRDAYGQHSYEEEVTNKRERAKGESQSLASYTERPSHIALYHTGPLILHHFNDYLGEEQFRKLIQEMIEERIATNEELLNLIRDLFGNEAERKLIDLRNSVIGLKD